MDYFYSKTKDNNLWLGFNPQNGWVIYDRKLPSNKSTLGEVYWIKCSDWTFFKDEGSNWNHPEYSFVVTYLKDLEINQQKENEEKALSILDFLSHPFFAFSINIMTKTVLNFPSCTSNLTNPQSHHPPSHKSETTLLPPGFEPGPPRSAAHSLIH